MISSIGCELPVCQIPAENTLRVCDVHCCPIHSCPLPAVQHLCAQQQLSSHSTRGVTNPEVPAIASDLACSGGPVVEATRLSHLLLMSREWEWCHLWADSSHCEAVEGRRESMRVEESSAISQTKQNKELVYPGHLKLDVSLCAKRATVTIACYSLFVCFSIFLWNLLFIACWE